MTVSIICVLISTASIMFGTYNMGYYKGRIDVLNETAEILERAKRIIERMDGDMK